MRVVCDIDGVLADVREYVEEYLLGKSDWESYFEHTLRFPPIAPMITLVRSLGCSGETNTVYLLTGRPESNRELTEIWLRKNLLSGLMTTFSSVLLMRPNGDNRPSSSIKMERIRWARPHLIIEDDSEVVEAATKEGFAVLQVHGFRRTKRDNTPYSEVSNV